MQHKIDIPNAGDMKISDTIKQQFIAQANDILYIIVEDIKKANKEGKSNLRFNIPTIFNIAGDVSNEKTKLEIHYIIAKSLIEKGYLVSIENSSSRVFFIITWRSNEEMNADREKTEFLRKLFK